LNTWISSKADLALDQLAKRYSVTKRVMLERLICEADDAILKTIELDRGKTLYLAVDLIISRLVGYMLQVYMLRLQGGIMARLSISEAARQAGISRQYLHKLIKAGTVAASTDEVGNRYIDESELLRAFEGRLPKVKAPSTKETPPIPVAFQHTTPQNKGQITALQTEVQLLREQMADAKEREQVEVHLLREQLKKSEEREQRLLDQVDKLMDTIKQIEHRPEPEQVVVPVKRGWLSKLLGRK
jgi:DNA-binding transcriptional MerR regulator